MSPGLFLGRRGEFHAQSHQLIVGTLDIVTVERCRREPSDAIRVALRSEKDHQGLGTRYRKFNPSLLAVEWPVGEDPEPQLFGVERQRPVLVCYWNTDELDALNHAFENTGSCSISQSLFRYYLLRYYSG